MKYKSGTKVKCFIGSKPTEVTGIVMDCGHFAGFVNMRGKSFVKFDKPVKLGDRIITATTLSNRQIEGVEK